MQVRLQKQAEASAVSEFAIVQSRVENLSNYSNSNSNSTIQNAEVQAIINDLEQIELGTTVSLEAQRLIKLARNKLDRNP